MLRARLVVVALAALAALASGCSNEAEGQPCSVKSYGNDPNGQNGADDCADGLVCTRAGVLNSNSDLCCPPDPRNATVPECIPGSGGVAADAGSGTDASSTSDASASDATADTSTDVSSDGATGEAAASDGATGDAATE